MAKLERDSDVDEDESRMEASDPKSDTSLMLPSCFVNLPPTVWLRVPLPVTLSPTLRTCNWRLAFL